MFVKGQKKIGGRKKGGAARKSTRLIDQLKDHGFNFVKEFALCLKSLPEKGNVSPLSNSEFPGTKYSELKSLLPYMAPKLREREVELMDKEFPGGIQAQPATITDEELMKALDNGSDKQNNSRPSNPHPVAKRSLELQAAPSPEVHLQDMAGKQEDN